MTVVLRLPYPVSANRYWRHVRRPGRTYVVLSDEAHAYRQQVRVACVGVIRPSTAPVAVALALHPRITKHGAASQTCLDLDNAIKVLLDALQGHAFENDRQVRRLVAEYGPPLDGGGVTVTVEAWE